MKLALQNILAWGGNGHPSAPRQVSTVPQDLLAPFCWKIEEESRITCVGKPARRGKQARAQRRLVEQTRQIAKRAAKNLQGKVPWFLGLSAGLILVSLGLPAHAIRVLRTAKVTQKAAPLLVAPLPVQEIIPVGFPATRYEAMLEKSPFFPPAAPASAIEPIEGESLTLAGMAAIGEENFVALFDKKSQEYFTVTSTTASHGIEIQSIHFDNDLLKSSATLRRGGETLVVRYDPALLAAGSMPEMEGSHSGPNVYMPGEPGAMPQPAGLRRRSRLALPVVPP